MGLIVLLLNLYGLVLLVRVVLSFFPVTEGTATASIYDVCYTLTEPVLAPIRSVIGPVDVGASAFDLSPIVVFVAIAILSRILG